MNRRALVPSLAALVALSLASCGEDEEASSTAGTTSTSTGASGQAGAASDDDVYVGTVGVVPARGGTLVRSLEVGSPIEGSGLQARDVIVAVDDAPIETIEELTKALRGLGKTYDGGDEVPLTVTRGKEEKTLTVTLAANVYLGVELADAEKGGGGALAKTVPKEGPADDAGMEPRDVIVAIDGRAVAATDDVLQALATHVAGDEVEIEVKRGSQERTLEATLDKRGHGRIKGRSNPGSSG